MSVSSYRIAQDFEYVGNDYWKWNAWIEANDAELDAIEKVVWLLHPTFAKQRIPTKDRSTNFGLESAGWGTFVLRAEVTLKNRETHQLRHNLKLEYPEELAQPRQRARSRASSPTAETAKTASPESTSRAPWVYLSYSSVDARAASRLREGLTRAGVQVLDQTQVATGMPPAEALQNMIATSDAVIGLIGDDQVSPFVTSEIDFAIASAKPTLALVSTDAGSVKLPSEIELQQFQPEEFEHGELAHKIASWVAQARER